MRLGMEIATRRREQEVWQACDDLWALNGDLKTLTGDAIRERLVSLGKSRGSPNEIYKYRRSWGESRGLHNAPSDSTTREENDPITRAVRLVHEKLQQESKDEIESIQQEVLAKLSVKDNEIAKLKEDLSLVVEEFSKAQQENSRLQKNLAAQALELEAERGVRSALERELDAQKKEHKLAFLAHNELLSATKAAQLETIALLKESHAKETASFSERLKESEREKKELGHQFSEQLNEFKLNEYNLKLQNNAALVKLEEYKAQSVAQQRAFSEQKDKVHEALSALGALKVLATNFEKMSHYKYELEQERKRFGKLSHAHKAHELTIARLRALLSHQEQRWKR